MCVLPADECRGGLAAVEREAAVHGIGDLSAALRLLEEGEAAEKNGTLLSLEVRLLGVSSGCVACMPLQCSLAHSTSCICHWS